VRSAASAFFSRLEQRRPCFWLAANFSCSLFANMRYKSAARLHGSIGAPLHPSRASGFSRFTESMDQQSEKGRTMRSVARWTAACAVGFLLIWVALAVQPAAAQQGVPRDALLRFEENVKWEAVSDDWAGKRDRWIAAVQSARSPADVAAQVLTLEAMGWPSVEDTWRGRRDNWVAEMSAARTRAAVARGLLELEAATKWSAVEPAWRQMRDGWVARLQAVQ
jgi:hypothetical protein